MVVFVFAFHIGCDVGRQQKIIELVDELYIGLVDYCTVSH